MTALFPKYMAAFVLAFVLGSCARLGLNLQHETPSKPGRIKKFTVQDSLKGHNGVYRACFDVRHYDIHLSISPADKSISGHITTTFDLLTPSLKIQLDLDHQFIIDSIVQDHRPLDYQRQFTALFVSLPFAASRQQVTVYYHGKPKAARRPPWEGGFVWKKDKNGKPWVGVSCEGDGAQTWLAIKAYIGDEPDSVTTHFTVPKDLVAVSNGNLLSVAESGAYKTYSWQTSYNINPYNITVYAGDYRLVEDSYACIDGSPMKLSYYVLPYNEEKAKTHFKQVPKILHAYESFFGCYPWIRDGYRLVESPFEGMEHQSAIAYGNGYKNAYKEDFDYIILHETAHEWWGNAVSCADFSDIWIHEGMATYAEALYVEQTQGHDAYENYINWTETMVTNKYPMVLPPSTAFWDYKDGDVYNKGSAAMHTLRCVLDNDSLFFRIIKTFFATYCYHNTNTQAFINLVNQETGKDYTWFFRQYFYRRESPLLVWNYGVNDASGQEILIYQLKRVDEGFTVPVKIKAGKTLMTLNPGTTAKYIPYDARYGGFYLNTSEVYLQEQREKVLKTK